jgi:ABC-type branched-subunit amino acid transport system substrate-binding protein
MSARVWGSIMAVTLLVGACGSRAETADDPADTEGPPPTSTGTPVEDGMFGTLESPCGPTPDGMTLTASDQGVTADSIEVTTISDPGGPVPGLNQGMFDSMHAFADWCNEQGGSNGRELIVKEGDAALLQYKERILEACATSFALVGGGGVFDNTGAQEAVDCGLVDVAGYTVSPEKALSDRMVQPQPNQPNMFNVGTSRWIAEQSPEAAEKAAMLYSNVDTVKSQAERAEKAQSEVGYDFVYSAAANVNEVNWAPHVIAMRNAGVEYVTLTSSWEEGGNLQKAMVEQGFEPEFTELETNFYNPKYPESAGAAADGTYVRLTVWPFEEADDNPAMTQYLEALRKTNGDDVVPEMLGVQSFSAGLMFATAAKAAGADLTRDSLLAELEKIDEWDGGGLHGTNDPAANENGGCFIVMQVVDGGFERVYPDKEEGFDCGRDNFVEVDIDFAEGAKESS